MEFGFGFRIPIAGEIPESFGCIPDSKLQDSGFYKQKFLALGNPDSLSWRNRETKKEP